MQTPMKKAGAVGENKEGKRVGYGKTRSHGQGKGGQSERKDVCASRGRVLLET